MKTTVSVNL